MDTQELLRTTELAMIDAAKTMNTLDAVLLERTQALYLANQNDPDIVEISKVRGRLIAAIGALEKFYDNVSVVEARGVEYTRELGTNSIIGIKPNNKQSMTVRFWKGMDEWTDDPKQMQTEVTAPVGSR